MFFKANALDALGKFDEAIKCYDQVITIQQESSDTLYYRGRSKVKNGDIMGGLSDLKAALNTVIDRTNEHEAIAPTIAEINFLLTAEILVSTNNF